MNLFSEGHEKFQPLSFRLKPDDLDGFYGQEHIMGKNKVLRELIEKDKIKSLILFGPPGTGKSLIAHIIARKTSSLNYQINAVLSNVTELRQLIKKARLEREAHNKWTIIFIDEIHRFNKAQQDALLPPVETGEIILIGATTQNPFFYIIPALQSRSHIFEFKPLEKNALESIFKYALEDRKKGLGEMGLAIKENVKAKLIEKAGGDARKLLNMLEMCALLAGGKKQITDKIVTEVLSQEYHLYDKKGDYHYDIISAFIKSLRGSDPDAAVYWLARMIAGGEDPRFIARRLVIFASEDVGNAYPMGLVVAQACFDAVTHIGMPESRIILAHTTTFLATAPKSNASYMAIDKALDDVNKGVILEVPKHLKDSHYASAGKLGHGDDYQYPHDFKGHWVDQDYVPMKKKYYKPTDIGYEKKIIEFMKNIEKMKKKN
ncbi:MAG: replication-associated recombination protein A [Spirochaetes bacterium]|nr:replication-associated recombination protein A [Spirochaetota bacterium]